MKKLHRIVCQILLLKIEMTLNNNEIINIKNESFLINLVFKKRDIPSIILKINGVLGAN